MNILGDVQARVEAAVDEAYDAGYEAGYREALDLVEAIERPESTDYPVDTCGDPECAWCSGDLDLDVEIDEDLALAFLALIGGVSDLYDESDETESKLDEILERLEVLELHAGLKYTG